VTPAVAVLASSATPGGDQAGGVSRAIATRLSTPLIVAQP